MAESETAVETAAEADTDHRTGTTRGGLVPGDDAAGVAALVAHPEANILVRIPSTDADAAAFEERLDAADGSLDGVDVALSLNHDDNDEVVERLTEGENPATMVYPVRKGELDERAAARRDADGADVAFLVHGENDARAMPVADGLTVQSLTFAPGDETGSRQVAAVVDEHRDTAFVFAGENALDTDDESVDVESRLDVAGEAFAQMNDDRLSDDADVVLQAPGDVDPDSLTALAAGVDATEVWFSSEPTEASTGRLDRLKRRLTGAEAPRSPRDALPDDVAVRVRGEDTAPALAADREGSEREAFAADVESATAEAAEDAAAGLEPDEAPVVDASTEVGDLDAEAVGPGPDEERDDDRLVDHLEAGTAEDRSGTVAETPETNGGR